MSLVETSEGGGSVMRGVNGQSEAPKHNSVAL